MSELNVDQNPEEVQKDLDGLRPAETAILPREEAVNGYTHQNLVRTMVALLSTDVAAGNALPPTYRVWLNMAKASLNGDSHEISGEILDAAVVTYLDSMVNQPSRLIALEAAIVTALNRYGIRAVQNPTYTYETGKAGAL